jgi:hypothetical protein
MLSICDFNLQLRRYNMAAKGGHLAWAYTRSLISST